MPTCKRMYTGEQSPVRERLLQGASRCLQEKGYAETTARDIAAASGANLRSIGYHFGSTKSLLLAAISLNFRRWLEPLIAAATDEQKHLRREAGPWDMALHGGAIGERSHAARLALGNRPCWPRRRVAPNFGRNRRSFAMPSLRRSPRQAATKHKSRRRRSSPSAMAWSFASCSTTMPLVPKRSRSQLRRRLSHSAESRGWPEKWDATQPLRKTPDYLRLTRRYRCCVGRRSRTSLPARMVWPNS